MTKILIPEAALKKHIAILGMNGSGKTSVAKSQIIEPALEAGERVCNIDPTGVGWGLRLSASGKSKGFPVYIVGGDRADFPLFKRDGNAWAEIVGTSSDSFVFDTSQMTVTDRSLWFTDFAEALIRRNSGPLKLVLDEAHLFAPQGGAKSGGVAPEMLHATNNLLALGRSKGLRITMISQRPAKLHKDSLTQAHTLIAMMLMAPQDREAVKDWIADQADAGTGKEIIASLPSLAPGEGWIWAPRERVLERVKFPRPRTFDSSSAPEDDDGKAISLTPINPDAIKAKLATVAKETVANDPKIMRAEIARLTAELKAEIEKKIAAKPPSKEALEKIKKQALRQAAKSSAPLIAAVEAAMKFIVTINAKGFLSPGEGLDQKAMEKAIEAATAHITRTIDAHLQSRGKQLDAVRAEAERIVKQLKGLMEKAGEDVAIDVNVEHREAFSVSPAAPAKPIARTLPAPRPTNGSGEPKIGKGEAAVMKAVAQYPAGASREQLTVLTGYKKSSRDTYLQRLGAAGWVVFELGAVRPTQAGIDGLGSDYEPLPTGNALREHWLKRLGGGEREILKYLVEAYPKAVERDQISENTNYKKSSRDTYLQRLGARMLVVADRGTVRASEILFGD